MSWFTAFFPLSLPYPLLSLLRLSLRSPSPCSTKQSAPLRSLPSLCRTPHHSMITLTHTPPPPPHRYHETSPITRYRQTTMQRRCGKRAPGDTFHITTGATSTHHRRQLSEPRRERYLTERDSGSHLALTPRTCSDTASVSRQARPSRYTATQRGRSLSTTTTRDCPTRRFHPMGTACPK